MAIRARFVCIGVAVLCLAAGGYATPIAGVYNTGAGLNAGVQDSYWKIYFEGTLTSTYTVVDNGHPNTWLANGEVSKWIAPHPDYRVMTRLVDPPGAYEYVLQFDLSAYKLSTIDMAFRWTSDNSGVAVLLNGAVLPGAPTAGFWGFRAFTSEYTIPVEYFRSGINTLTFQVMNEPCIGCMDRNIPNPTGVRVEFTRADGMLLTPEPASAGVAGLGLFGLFALIRRRRRA